MSFDQSHHSPFASVHHESAAPLSDEQEKSAWIAFGVLVAALTYGYGNMLAFTSSFWGNPLYSHGWIVPAFAGYLFWSRRQRLTEVSSSDRWIGLVVLCASMLVRLYASSIDMNPVDRLTYVFALLGVCLLVGGMPMLKWAGPPIGFLFFMYPMPSVVEDSVLLNLQRWAAHASTWTLQLIGVPAVRDGSRIVIDTLSEPLDVADACSGLRMGTIFGAMSVALAMIINRPWWDRLTILVGAIPVALVTNVLRITITALIYMAFPESDAIHLAVHDWAGIAMMPIALGFLWLELQILSRISVPIDADDEYAQFGTITG